MECAAEPDAAGKIDVCMLDDNANSKMTDGVGRQQIKSFITTGSLVLVLVIQ